MKNFAMEATTNHVLVLALIAALAVGTAAEPGPLVCTAPRDGHMPVDLVGYWPLATNAEDASGAGYHMLAANYGVETSFNNTDLNAPFSDGYVAFENTGKPKNMLEGLVVRDFDPRSFDNSGSYTWEFWFKVALDDNANGDKQGVNGDWFVSYAIAEQSNQFFASTGLTNNNCNGGKDGTVVGTGAGLCAESDGWHHYAFTADLPNKVAKLYIDGTIVATKNTYQDRMKCSIEGSSLECTKGGTLAFGVELDSMGSDLLLNQGQRLDGAMTEVRFWNYARSKEEINNYKNLRIRDVSCKREDLDLTCTPEQAASTCDAIANCEVVDGQPTCFCHPQYNQLWSGLGGCVEKTNPLATVTCEDGLVTNLAGYWPLANNADDNSGSGFHMSAEGAGVNPSFKSDDSNAPFSDGYVVFENTEKSVSEYQLLFVKDFNPKSYMSGGSYTWEFWFKVSLGDNAKSNSNGNTQGVNGDWFVSYSMGSGSDDNEFFASTGKISSVMNNKCTGGKSGVVVGTGADLCAESDNWHHYAFTVDLPNEEAALYIDGIVQAQTFNYNYPPLRCKTTNTTDNSCLEGGTLAFGVELDGPDTFGLVAGQRLDGAMTEVRYWTEARSRNQIIELMYYRVGELQCGVYEQGQACSETEGQNCHKLANCEVIDTTPVCSCEMGLIGDGVGPTGCRDRGWTLRTVYEWVYPWDLDWMLEPAAANAQTTRLKECFGADAVHFQRGVAPFSDAAHFPYAEYSLLVNALFDSEPSDDKIAALNASACFEKGTVSAAGTRKYIWVSPTSDAGQSILPTGLTVDNVHFEPACAETGCWVIDVTYTTGGPGAFNSFFLPHAESNETLSYDFDYSDNTDNTFFPRNFPCRTHTYILPDGSVPESLPDQITTCCLTDSYTPDSRNPTDTTGGFVADYRPTQAFTDWVTEMDPLLCTAGTAGTFPDLVDRPEYNESEHDAPPSVIVDFPVGATVPHPFLDNKFKGLPVSPGVVSTTTLDPFFYQYTATIKLDEAEVRRKAGVLKGTVGVETTVDTFLGFVNFRPTGLPVLDAFATQQALHFEKTSFFSVATHGTNVYTFLQYVNLRLVAIYTEDSDFSSDAESTARTVRTDSTGAAHYVQVTFTLGSQYQPNTNSSGLIPLDSVRAGTGVFFETATLEHTCSQWSLGDLAEQAAFNTSLIQGCAPNAAMCASPEAIPDQFVAFNIPLGIDQFGDASSTLDNNVFISLVVSAIDTVAMGGSKLPNAGGEAHQMKTTLTASIPVVEGGINIFCDGFTSKTDLQDVANVDIVVGSAKTKDELSRLTIKKNISRTQLEPETITEIDSASIEAGLMTLVLKGEDSHFGPGNSGVAGVSMELEDVITIHIMQADDGRGENADVVGVVNSLITSDPDDNSDSNGLITEGYALNGAFTMRIDRASLRAHLEPTQALLDACPFNPPRPTSGTSLESCITRRDVRYRGYPARVGGVSTAMEICANLGGADGNQGVNSNCAGQACCSSSLSSNEAKFMTTILGASEYAKGLAVDYASVIATEYQLNQRYRRAYWINPGYEWTPTQTGGTSMFSLSQKIFLFALVTLDEGISTVSPGDIGDLPSLPARRRVLLSSSPDSLQDAQAALGGEVLGFKTSPRTMMANAFGVPETLVATFAVTLQLSADEACMESSALQGVLRDTLVYAVTGKISAYHTLEVSTLVVSKGSVTCDRRRVRLPLASSSDASAEVTMLVVFKKGTPSVLDLAALEQFQGIQAITPLTVSPLVSTVPEGPIQLDPSADEQSGADEQRGGVGAAVIGGICGALAVVLAGGVLLVWWFKLFKQTSVVEEATMEAVDINALKASLANEV